MSTVVQSWKEALVLETATIGAAIEVLNSSGIKICMVVNTLNQLQGTVSDGDLRRGLLSGLSVHDSVMDIIHRDPIVVPIGFSKDVVTQLMLANKIQQIPVVDSDNGVLDLISWDGLLVDSVRPNTMVIMAGGKGTRLLPITENCPKPMILVAGKPMLEHIILRAKNYGISKFLLAINYLGHQIEEYFNNGNDWGVSIEYLRESSPLGTAGALSLIEGKMNHPFVVTNGDVLTDVDYGEILDFHIRNKALATMAIRSYEVRVPYGVVLTDGISIKEIKEKPVSSSYINAGVYILSPRVQEFVRESSRLDMPELFRNMIASDEKITAFPMHEPWLDVGRHSDLELANRTH